MNKKTKYNILIVILAMITGAYMGLSGVFEPVPASTQYGEELVNVCDRFWRDADEDSTDMIPDDEAVNAANLNNQMFLVLTMKNGFLASEQDDKIVSVHNWQNRIPEENQAQNEHDRPIVICVSEYDTVIEVCNYSDGSWATRYQHFADLAFVNSQTGDLIGFTTLRGEKPGKCLTFASNDRHGRFGNKLFDVALDNFIANLP